MVGPILFMPSLFGSKLRAPDGAGIWSNWSSIKNTLARDHLLPLRSNVSAYEVFEQFEAQSSFLGFSFKSDPVPVYAGLIDLLRQTERDVHCFPYNWTRSAGESALALDRWFCKKRDQEGEPTAGWTAVAHGFGGLVLFAFLALDRRCPIAFERIVLCGVPLAGCARSIGARYGLDADIDQFVGEYAHHLSLSTAERRKLRLLLLQMPSLYDLTTRCSEILVHDPQGRPRRARDVVDYLRGDRRRNWRNADRKIASAEGPREISLPIDAANVLKSAGDPHLSVFCSNDFPTPYRAAFDGDGILTYPLQGAGDLICTTESALTGISPAHEWNDPVEAEHWHYATSGSIKDWVAAELSA